MWHSEATNGLQWDNKGKKTAQAAEFEATVSDKKHALKRLRLRLASLQLVNSRQKCCRVMMVHRCFFIWKFDCLIAVYSVYIWRMQDYTWSFHYFILKCEVFHFIDSKLSSEDEVKTLLSQWGAWLRKLAEAESGREREREKKTHTLFTFFIQGFSQSNSIKMHQSEDP